MSSDWKINPDGTSHGPWVHWVIEGEEEVNLADFKGGKTDGQSGNQNPGGRSGKMPGSRDAEERNGKEKDSPSAENDQS